MTSIKINGNVIDGYIGIVKVENGNLTIRIPLGSTKSATWLKERLLDAEKQKTKKDDNKVTVDYRKIKTLGTQIIQLLNEQRGLKGAEIILALIWALLYNYEYQRKDC